jgi:Mg-chelatase subunit ChlD
MSNLPENFICPITQDLMTDPVMCEDGITYERSAITQWLQTHDTSPVTRKQINKYLIPNIALRNIIHDYFAKQKLTSTSHKPIEIQKPQNKTNIIHTQNVCQYNGDYYSMLTLNFTNIMKKNNIIVAVVDTSGSMGESADVPGIESSGLSRLDLVKHTLNTFLHSLSDNDMLCIITFSNSAQVVSDFIKLDHSGKSIVSDNIKKLDSNGMTNLWAGIKLGMDKIASVYNDAYNISMLVMTDGISNSDPPRGIIPTLQDQIALRKLHFSINTFGYGYNIDSNLLYQIANISNGIFGFIPDATMVGTTFINMIASIINGSVNHLEVKNIDDFKMCTPSNFGMISTNQPIHIIFKGKHPLKSNITIKFDNTDIYTEIYFDTPTTEMTKTEFEQFKRLELCDIINQTLISQNNKELLSFQTLLLEQNKKFKSSYITDLIDDIFMDDPNKGQLSKAVEKSSWFEQWGNHYLKAIRRAHQLEKCITFKELSPQHYTSPEFKSEQSRVEQLFCDLPAPIPSNMVHKSKSFGNRTFSNQSAHVSMSTYYTQSGGCFDGNSKVKMYNPDTQKYYYNYVHEVRSGDYVYSPMNTNKFTKVVCVLKLKINKKIRMCNINDMLITPYHPININNEWKFPYYLTEPILNEIDYVYDFVLESGHIIEINEINVVTLGHGFNFNSIVSHEYFGDKIIDDLMTHPGWSNGYIELNNYKFIRGYDMRINKLRFKIE